MNHLQKTYHQHPQVYHQQVKAYLRGRLPRFLSMKINRSTQDSSTLDSGISEDDYKEIKKSLSLFSDRLSDFEQKLEKSEKILK